MSITQAFISEFLDHLRYQKRYSQHTLVSYQTDLRAFFDYAETESGVVSMKDVTPPMVRSWLASLKSDGLGAKSINRKISSLRSFYRYQQKEHKLVVNPVSGVIALKVSKRLPAFIEEKDMDTLFNHVQFPDTWQGVTDRLLLLLFYNTGMRLSELINLKESHLDSSNSNIKVLGKGNKERLIPVQDELMKNMFAYINDKKNIAGADLNIFVDARGKKLYPRYVYSTVKKYLGAVTTNARKSPHILRHSFATHLTNNGADINAVKELLGHSSLAATQIYTSNSIEKLKDIHKKAHPKGE